jgi:hypothetical protein
MREEVKLIPRLLGRSGAVVCIGFENTSRDEALVTNISLQCSARSESIHRAMLFGVPLSILGTDRSIKVGISAFDIVIQGYSIDDPTSPLARRNFEHIFKMIRSRLTRITNSNSDSEASGAFADAALAFGKELIAVPNNDTDECAKRFSKFDAQLTHELSVKWLVSGGEIVSKHFDLNSKSVAWWLSNYAIGTEQGLMAA